MSKYRGMLRSCFLLVYGSVWSTMLSENLAATRVQFSALTLFPPAIVALGKSTYNILYPIEDLLVQFNSSDLNFPISNNDENQTNSRLTPRPIRISTTRYIQSADSEVRHNNTEESVLNYIRKYHNDF